MNQYATTDDFRRLFEGDLADNELNLKLQLSSEKIDTMTFNRIVKIGFNNLTKFQQEKVILAVCFQANYIIENENYNISGMSGFSVLDISINYDKNNQTEASRNDMSDKAFDFITPFTDIRPALFPVVVLACKPSVSVNI